MRVFAFFAVVLFAGSVFGGEPTKLIDRPNGESLAKADREAREVFKLEIEKAEKPADKTAQAEEFLKIAADTNDDEPTRLALLLLARKFAIEGRSLKTAATASIAIATRYLPEGDESTCSKKQFVKAQECWRKASGERAGSEDQIELQAKAIELYARANAGEGLSTIEKKLAGKTLANATAGNSCMGILGPGVAIEGGATVAGTATMPGIGMLQPRMRPPVRAAIVKKRQDAAADADMKMLVGKWNVYIDGRVVCQWAITDDGVVYSNVDKPIILIGRVTVSDKQAKIAWTGQKHQGGWNTVDISDGSGNDSLGNKIRIEKLTR